MKAYSYRRQRLIPRKELEELLYREIEQKEKEYDYYLTPQIKQFMVDKLIEYDISLGYGIIE